VLGVVVGEPHRLDKCRLGCRPVGELDGILVWGHFDRLDVGPCGIVVLEPVTSC